MDYFTAVTLGIIQGFTEFIPVSSSGHLILFESLFFDLEEQGGLFYHVILHVATLIPIFIIFWKDIWALIKNPFQKMTYMLVIATIPAVIAALLFGSPLSAFFIMGIPLACAFAVTGILLITADIMSARVANKSEKKEVSWLDAIIIGLFQAVGITPGVSRSGSTITGALIRGIDRETAAKFSFLLAIPAILGGLVYEMYDLVRGDYVIPSSDFLPMAMGFVAAACTGYLAIKLMLALIKKCRLRYFAYYMILMAVVIGILSVV
jgi:undecaprenyl-diphosphatase